MTEPWGPGARIAYIVHDLTDPAVARRIRMFAAGGASVRVAGFTRRAPPDRVAGAPASVLGRSHDARLAQRAGLVARTVLRPATALDVADGADVVVARNLEALAVAARVRRPGQRLVYECLDIHRLLTAPNLAGRVTRAIERRLLARVDTVLTSAPPFADRHFRATQRFTGSIRVEENRVLALDEAPVPVPSRTGPPWRIGWFGMLRCRRSLATLRALAQRGAAEVLIAGIPSYGEFEDFDRDVLGLPGLTFAGRYRAEDLSGLYGSVDFAWAIDWFEEGLNSSWLLPNRLYESLAYGAVPIALTNVETGRWLERHDVGVRVDDPAAELPNLLTATTPEAMAALRARAANLPRDLLVAGPADCRALVAAVAQRETAS